MSVTFGRIGRGFLLAGGAAAILTGLAFAVLDGTAMSVVAMSLGIIAVVAIVQGIVWTVVQHRMFGSVRALERVAAEGRPATAVIVSVRSTSSEIGAEPIARLELSIHGEVVTRHVRVPFNYATDVRPGRELPVRTDPDGSRAMIVEWDRIG